MNKQIENIVFYKYYDMDIKQVVAKSCIFYSDGSYDHLSKEEGKNAVCDFVKQKGYTKMSEVNSCTNIHYFTKEEFDKKFENILSISKKETSSKDSIYDLEKLIAGQEDAKEKYTTMSSLPPKKEELPEKLSEDELEDEKEVGIFGYLIEKAKEKKDKKNKDKKSKKTKEKKNKKSFFKRMKTRTTALVTAGVLFITSAIGGSALVYKKLKATKSTDNPFAPTKTNANTLSTDNMTDQDVVRLAKKDYNFSELRQLTNNKTQLNQMTKIGTYLTLFNGTFANKVKDKNSSIKPALKWDEVMALNIAYNDFTPEQIRAMYNGSTINVNNYDAYYKDANNQLIAAYIMEEENTLVNLDKLIDSKKGKVFNIKFHELFKRAKQTTGQEQIDAIDTFYKELDKEFKFKEKDRYNGVAHADERINLKSYMLSVAPMVQASEMLFRNLGINHTLSDKAFDYFNEQGLCNLAKESFESARLATYTAEKDNTNPTYKQYRKAKINELKENDWYNVKDKDRNVMELSKFKKYINGKFEFDENENFTGEYSYTTQSSTSKTTKTVTKTTNKHKKIKKKTPNRKEAVKKVGEKEVEKKENKIRKQDAKDNANRKKKGEETAKKNQEAIQKEKDKEAESKKQEVEKSDNDLKDKINSANDKINNNNKDEDKTNDTQVNEKDFGDHNVSFDDEHKDDQGNLNDSVKNPSTSGSDTEETLPDPNESGKDFDSKAPAFSDEEIASQIVEYMAENPTDTYENAKSYKYTR